MCLNLSYTLKLHFICCCSSYFAKLLGYLFAADEHSAQPHWGYFGDTGPAHWGELSPDYAACSQGKQQSPVNITHAQHAKLPIIEFDYKPSALDVINNGHTIESDYEPGSSITIDGKTYNLVQFHFHHLSENTLNGKHYLWKDTWSIRVLTESWRW